MMSYSQYIATIAKNIRELLDLYSMSILELSNKSGVSYSPLHSITLGKSKPTLETLYKICVVFHIDIAQLVGDSSLKLRNDYKLTRNISLLDWKSISFNPQDISNVEKITVTSFINLSTQAFALKAQGGLLFPDNTILIFDIPNDTINQFVGKIILVSSEKTYPTLKKLVADGKTLFLESLTEKIPTRKLLSSDKIIAFLVQSITSFI